MESLWRRPDSPPTLETEASLQSWLRSHQFDGDSLDDVLFKVNVRLEEKYPETAATLIDLAGRVSESEWGRSLLKNRGLNWRTTDMLFDLELKAQMRAAPSTVSWVDQFFFFEAPSARATQERFHIFQQVTQNLLRFFAERRQPITLASLPCGRMRDLVTLDYQDPEIAFRTIRLLGIDLDPEAVAAAHQFHEKLSNRTSLPPASFMRRNALDLNLHEAVTIINSNGLTIYLNKLDRMRLFQNCYEALERGGYLVVSHMMPPTEWLHGMIDQNALGIQRQVLTQVVDPLWENHFESRDSIIEQLESAGFVDITVFPDSRGIFPTFLARKA